MVQEYRYVPDYRLADQCSNCNIPLKVMRSKTPSGFILPVLGYYCHKKDVLLPMEWVRSSWKTKLGNLRTMPRHYIHFVIATQCIYEQ